MLPVGRQGWLVCAMMEMHSPWQGRACPGALQNRWHPKGRRCWPLPPQHWGTSRGWAELTFSCRSDGALPDVERGLQGHTRAVGHFPWVGRPGQGMLWWSLPSHVWWGQLATDGRRLLARHMQGGGGGMCWESSALCQVAGKHAHWDERSILWWHTPPLPSSTMVPCLLCGSRPSPGFPLLWLSTPQPLVYCSLHL